MEQKQWVTLYDALLWFFMGMFLSFGSIVAAVVWLRGYMVISIVIMLIIFIICSLILRNTIKRFKIGEATYRKH